MKKNLPEGFKGLFEQVEERMRKLTDRTREIIESQTQKEKTLKESEQRLRDLWGTLKQSSTLWESKKKRGVGVGKEYLK